MVRNFINIYNICGIYLTVKLLVILFILKSYAQISVFKPKFLRLRVVLVHNSRSNDSRSNDARFMHKLYLSLSAIKRMNTTHIALKNYKILLILIQIGINSLLEKLQSEKIKQFLSNSAHLVSPLQPFYLLRELIYAKHA